MKLTALSLFLILFLFLAASRGVSQTGSISGRILDIEQGTGLPGANVVVGGTTAGAATDDQGAFLIVGIPPGEHTIRASLIGFAQTEIEVTIAVGETLTIELRLEPSHTEVEEVVVTGTRTVRSIADVPVRVEVIPEEEVEEKLLMTPSSVAMLLNESTGMRVQTTSASSNSANLRIQGLSGRYTQLLTDGIPNFGGLSAGFSITQLPPLHLRQVEVIKGATSTLYGPDAISGVVNFLTKNPPDEGSTFSGLLNATTAEGRDAALFYSARPAESFGFTVFASGNTQDLYDVDGDLFADIAGYDRVSVSPKLQLSLGEDGDARLTLGYLTEDRNGGWMGVAVPASGPPPYTEQIETRRWDASSEVNLRLDGGRTMGIKLAGMQMKRDAAYGASPFNATQEFAFADAQYVEPFEGGHSLLLGAAFNLEDFDDRTPGISASRSYIYRTTGLFAQGEWKISPVWTALAGGRFDFHNIYGTFFTPRLSVKFAPSSEVTIRAGGGSGFKAPTIFVEEAEEVGFRNVQPIGDAVTERAVSASFDVNWNTLLTDDVTLGVNAAFYLSRISHTLLTDEDSLMNGGMIYFRNATGPLLARGGELSLKTGYRDFKLFLGYTFIYATREDSGTVTELTLNPRHSAGAVLFYENEEAGLKIGFETYLTGEQLLERNPYRDVSPVYVLNGLIAEKTFGIVRLFVNFENIFDVRQTRWDPLVVGPPDAPDARTVPVYAPLEGRVINGGVRVVL